MRALRRFLAHITTAAAFAAVLCAPPASASGLVSIGAGLRGPAGLHAAVFAQAPKTVATLATDTHGRVWMTAAGLSNHRYDGVYLLPRAGGTAIEIVKGLNDPLGIVWRGDQLYVASLGRVDVYSGLRGTRFTRHRKLVDGPVAGGENNNLVFAPDGRFVMGITASCDHCVPRSRYSGAVVSFKPDGSDLQVVAGHIRAPVGLLYVPGTNTLLASMNLRDDLGARTPGDQLAVIRRGQDWRQPGCYGQGGAACRGVPGVLATLDPHAAAGGIAVVDGQLGRSVGTVALVGEWQRSVVRSAPLRGGSPTRLAPVFLRGITNPLALLVRDRALLVADWATGRIYRITS